MDMFTLYEVKNDMIIADDHVVWTDTADSHWQLKILSLVIICKLRSLLVWFCCFNMRAGVAHLAYLWVHSLAVWSCLCRSFKYCLAILPTKGSSVNKVCVCIVWAQVDQSETSRPKSETFVSYCFSRVMRKLSKTPFSLKYSIHIKFNTWWPYTHMQGL